MLQLSLTARNNMLNQIESTVGTTATLFLYAGPPPASCAAAPIGSPLVTMYLPADWMAAAVNGVKAKLGTWTANASAAGTIGHFRLTGGFSLTCHLQGTVSAPGGGGDMIIDVATVALNQAVTVTEFTLGAPHA